MGELDGEGMEIRWPMDEEGGVGRSEVELWEPDEAEETDMERPLPRRADPMGIGFEWVTESDILLLFEDIALQFTGKGMEERKESNELRFSLIYSGAGSRHVLEIYLSTPDLASRL